MEKYPKIKRLGDSENKGIFDVLDGDIIYVTEKVDGANARFILEKSEIVFGSRNVNDLEEDNKQFGKYIRYIKEKVNPEDLDQDLIYVGEFMTPHTLQYDWDNIPTFIGFDVLNKNTGLPLSPGYAKKKFEELGLEFVPILFKGTPREFLDKGKESFMSESKYRDGKPEGIVIKNPNRLNQYDRPMYAKVVNEDFHEKKKTFQPKKTKKQDTYRLVDEYVTEARIRKILNKMTVEEGKELSRKLTEPLFHRVINDTLQEEIIDIAHNGSIDEINFRLLYSLVPKKCVKVIDKVMDEKMGV